MTGATGPLLDRIVAIGKTLGVTGEATKTLLKIVGEETNVPDDKLAETLTRVANDYRKLQAIASAHGGHAMLKSAAGAGTSVQFWIPFHPPGPVDAGDAERRPGPDASYN